MECTARTVHASSPALSAVRVICRRTKQLATDDRPAVDHVRVYVLRAPALLAALATDTVRVRYPRSAVGLTVVVGDKSLL